MKFLIGGGTGFIGKALIASLSRGAHTIVVLTRSNRRDGIQGDASIRYARWDGRTQGAWAHEMDDVDCVINLTGKSLISGRWTPAVKRELEESRLQPVEALVRAMRDARRAPSLFVSVSAVGYYGDTGAAIVDESAPPGSDFLATLTLKWEAAAQEAAVLGVRTVTPRMGIVLEKNDGALEKMAMPFKFFVGGWIGSGTQYLSWIHMRDLIDALVLPVSDTSLSGAYNCTAPNPVTMEEFCRAIGRAMGRSCWTRMPEWAAKAVLGEAAKMLLTGQRAMPRRLTEAGFQFQYGNVDEALRNIFH